MPWPLVSHFSAMLQNPSVAFRDPDLKTSSIERDTLGQPRPWSGNFATVYRAAYANNGGAVAIRVFNREASDRRQRYEEISKYLADRQLHSLIGFQYVDRGIRSASDGKFYPMVTMQWVPGDTLFNWLHLKCSQSDAPAVGRVADQWVALISELRANQIVHGDLQHGNVMVNDAGELKLVDYDCMCVPALVGRQNLEIGVAPYQHPTRQASTVLSSELDNFSAIFIQLALRALSVDPTLWQRYVVQPGYDKMLIRTADLESPQTSPIYQELCASPNEEVRQLTGVLWQAFRQPPEQVPRLESLLNSYEKVAQLLAARDWDAAVQILEQSPPAGEAPPHLQPAINEAFQRVYGRKALDQAVAAGNEQEMIRLYHAQLLDDYPAAHPSVEVARDAEEVLRTLKRLKALHKQQAWPEFVAMWDEHRALLAGRKSAEAYERNAETWRLRIAHFEEVRRALNTQPADVRHLAAAWKALVAAGGHPDAKALQQQVNNILRREKALMALRRIPADQSEMNDRLTVETWNEDQLGGWDEGEQLRPLYDAARQRLEALSTIRLAASDLEQHASVSAERKLADAARLLPAGYDYEWRDRATKAIERIDALDPMVDALGEGDSDLAIARAWQRIVSVNARELISPEYHARIDEAVCRFPVLLELEDISLDLPPDELDRQLLAIWDEELFENSRDVNPWRDAYAAAIARKPLLDALEKSLRSDRVCDIERITNNESLVKYRFPRSWQEKIESAHARTKSIEDLLTALADDDRSKFNETFDQPLLCDHAHQLEVFHGALDDWMTTEILPLEKLGLALPEGAEPLRRAARKKYELRWNWPAERFSRQCIIGICPDQIKPDTDPEHAKALRTVTIPLEQWQSAGGKVLLAADGDWAGCHLYVWAAIDLGFRLFYSEALGLGRLPKLWM